MPDSASNADLSRYVRQMRYPPLGEAGQQRLSQSRALICGCGALGSVLANTLARAGVGHLRIVDRDFLELNNLQRQVLYDEDDVAAGIPKAVAAEAKLKKINSQITIEAIVADVDHRNIAELADGCGVLLDGTDNFETRFLLNDAAVRLGIPWVYGGCIGDDGQTMTILPGETPCLHCLMQDGPPPPGTTETCDSAGILSPIINVIASLEANEAIKILSGNRAATSRVLCVFELWENRIRQIKLDNLATVDCPTCKRREFPWLEGRRGSHTAVLCGRNAVQLSFPDRERLDLASLEKKLAGVGRVTRNRFLLRLEVDDYTATVFPDGRAIIGGTEEIAEARTVYAKYIGN
ncbi:MAG: ThiF family adenylyltransferase [Pirellulaceae bacterium]